METIVLKIEDFLDLVESRGHATYELQSHATGLGTGTLHRIRAGGPVSSSTAAAICAAYGVAFDDVFAFGTVTAVRAKPSVAGAIAA
ncbi:helix-turn-helix domain-containing protein [Streptomyces alboflavus]|uniref:helix-turn-helix domain-containing protein n=1 Tax=Streptomyces alboflavus TaxID=67267 RepID=UPI000F658CF5|nr:helix-turn-helix transcriptional regulator [Streptomyces alboflavus]